MNQPDDGYPLRKHLVDHAVSAEEQFTNLLLLQLRDNTASLR